MKIILIASTMLVAVFAPSGAFASSDNAAVITREFGCVLAGAASGLGVNLYSEAYNQEVDTSSGNTTLTCRFKIPEGYEPQKALRNSGFGCYTYAGGTFNSESVATPGGNAILKCQINPSGN